MKVLITGANGQLGQALSHQLGAKHELIGLSRNQLDVTNKEEVQKMITTIVPDIIIHAAAFTAVDACEKQPIPSYTINAFGSSNIATIAKQLKARFIYISTDYVFDGSKHGAYEETDTPNPLSVYGRSKWLGEKLVQEIDPDCTIIRTSWLYGHNGQNFVKTILQLAKKQKEIKVVDDQVGSPTYAVDLASFIETLLTKKTGLYHFSNTGSCSWYDFAKVILEEAGLERTLIKPITTKEYGAAAPRPAYSVLAHKKMTETGINIPRYWREALEEFIRKELSND